MRQSLCENRGADRSLTVAALFISMNPQGSKQSRDCQGAVQFHFSHRLVSLGFFHAQGSNRFFEDARCISRLQVRVQRNRLAHPDR